MHTIRYAYEFKFVLVFQLLNVKPNFKMCFLFAKCAQIKILKQKNQDEYMLYKIYAVMLSAAPAATCGFGGVG